MLNEREWNTMNEILLDLYSQDHINGLAEKILKVMRMMILYTRGYFILLNEDHQIIQDKSYFIGMDQDAIEKYVNHFYSKDYLQVLYDITEQTMVYKDTNILEDNVRKETEFYKMYLAPEDIPYGCGILLIRNHRIIGIINLFRSETLGDFTDKDIQILDVLKRHFENMVYRTMEDGREQEIVEKCIITVDKKYELTNREAEVLKLIFNGLSNVEICDCLMISLSTVKKHIYNIYTKMGVKSRTQVINMIYQSDKAV